MGNASEFAEIGDRPTGVVLRHGCRADRRRVIFPDGGKGHRLEDGEKLPRRCKATGLTGTGAEKDFTLAGGRNQGSTGDRPEF